MKLTIEGQVIGNIHIDFFDSDSIDGELIIYNETRDKIIALNITATYIFRYLVAAVQSGQDYSDKDILSYLKSVFQIEPDQEGAVLSDIQSVLYQFLEEGVIVIE